MAVLTAPVGAKVYRRPADKLLALAAVACLVFCGIAIFGRYLAPYDPDATDVLSAGLGPSSAHWLGTDSIGRDILSRALTGASLSFAGPLLIVVGSVVLGTVLALFAAWHGGWIDSLMNRLLNVMFAVPGILVAVIAAAVFGAGFWAPVLALILVYVPYSARIIRSAAVQERKMPYVEGLQLAGVSSMKISARHVLRNVWPLIVAQATLGFGTALADFAAVSFIGLGVQPPAAEWGVMVSDGRSELLDGAPQQSLVAGLCIVVAVVSFNLLGDRLAARFGAAR